MARKVWYINGTSKAKITNWGSAVSSGVAQFPIHKLIQDDGQKHPSEFLVAAQGAPVSSAEVTAYTAEQDSGSVPSMSRVSNVGKPSLTAPANAAPAGGTGAAAGGYDTAGNRDIMIAQVNNLRTRVMELEAALKKVGILS